MTNPDTKTVEEINKEILSLKKTAQSIYSEAERLKIYGIVISIFIPIWLLIHYFRFLKLQVINNLIIEFETKIHILSPYLSNKEILEFNALWANMNNEQDYIGIVKKIEEKQKEHNAPPLVLASC